MRLTVLGKSPSWQDAGGACSGYLTEEPARPRLIAPQGAVETFRRVVGSWGNEDLIENAFRIEEYAGDARPKVGPLEFSFRSVPHFLETYAIRVESSRNGGAFAFGADSRPTVDLVEFARDADLLLIEATLPRPERSGQRGHLTPREAGEHAKAAGVKSVLLTHMSDEMDELWARREAEAGFGGPVYLARE